MQISQEIKLKTLLQNPAFLIYAFGFCLILVLLTKIYITGAVIGSDGLGYYAHLRSVIIDGDLQYANEFRDFNPRGHGVPDPNILTATGHVPNKYLIGPAILWAPFFFIAHLFTLLAGKVGLFIEPDGYSVLYQFFIGLGSIVYGLAGLYFIYKINIFFFTKEEALLSTSFITLGTNVLYYLTNEPTMSHNMSMFSVSIFIYILIKNYEYNEKKYYIYLGIISGIMILVRPQNALFLILLLFDFLNIKNYKYKFNNYIFFTIFFTITLIPQFFVWKILYGHFLFYSYEGEGFNFLSPHLIDSLFSLRHGLVTWTPIIALALLGLFFFRRYSVKFALLFILAFVLQWYVNASWETWWFGHSFGGRAYINCSFLFAIGLSSFIKTTKKWNKFVILVSSILIFWNFLLIYMYIFKIISQSDSLDFENIIFFLIKSFNNILLFN